MSECTLYVLDAPRIKTPDGAARQVEKSQSLSRDAGPDVKGERAAPLAAAPWTPRLQAFFKDLLLAVPDDGSPSSIWYEGLEHSRPEGQVLALVFRLDLFDTGTLQRLRDLAGQHSLHVFDPEGHVLYLSNGREAVRLDQPPPFPLPGAPACTSGLRFDGVYELKMREGGYNYFCFTQDGRVLSQSISGRVGAKRVLQLMYACDAFVAKGPYKPGNLGSRTFTGRMRASYGSFKLDGELADDGSLRITSTKTRRPPHTGIYTFMPL